jgi:hypothetical protein
MEADNMGTSGKSASTPTETKLSRTQADILQNREQLFQRFVWPELRGELQASGAQGGQASPFQRQAAMGVNAGFQNAERQVSRSLAQRGLTGSGVEAGALSGMQNARTMALSDAMLKAQLAQRDDRLKLMQMAGAMSPQPTSATPMGSATETDPEPIWKALL